MRKFLSVKLCMLLSVFGLLSMTAQTTTEVSNEDLGTFADVYMAIQMENMKIQQDMVKVVEDSGLSVERFQVIQQAQVNPDATVDATEEEMKSFETVMGKLEAMQPALEAKMTQIVTANGMTIDTYQALAGKIQASTELQQKLQTLITERVSALEKTQG
ncbi:DUF4168 domain-containing protein [Neptunitalea lumnitzerae]|uniref:DUF4168 domain-containing protein n=1 Tax=Neptunitalea lumnitzerae TaxID=2965509 RepID=A0ABQ5MMJ8_9FLAO|nr:DUF4168 domain-containing protein [Neptunitalea sp. Y10]GLB50572.1 hypothetical protein Y10_29400 [Neptunitalea sp. Y10]